MKNMTHIRRAGGVAAILVALGFATSTGLEMYRSSLGFDADGASLSMAFLRQQPEIYAFSGFGSVVTGVRVVYDKC